MKKLIHVMAFSILVFLPRISLAAHPMLIDTRSQWSAMITSSTVHPWSDIMLGATTYLAGAQGTCYANPACYTFGSGSNSIEQQNENGFMNVMGSLTLLYVLNSNNSGSITYRNSILSLMDMWPQLRSDQPEYDGYNINVPMNSAFMNMTIAFDNIHDDLSSVKISSYEVMMDSWTSYSRGLSSSWALNNYGAYMTYSLYRSTDNTQIAVDTTCYHALILGNDTIYPPAVCDMRQAYRNLSSEIQTNTQLNTDGVSGSGSSYAWERLGGGAREKLGKWGGLFVANFTAADTTYTTEPKMSRFYQWLFSGHTNPWNAKVVFGDTANNQSISNDDYQALDSLYPGSGIFMVKNAHLVSRKYSVNAGRLANRSIAVSTLTVVYPGELIDYVSVTSSDTSTSQVVGSTVVRYGGASFWDEDQSTSALMGVLDNPHLTKSDHFHASDFNGLYLVGYGETLLSNVGIGATVQSGVLGFSHYWHRCDAHSGNVLLMGNVNYANDTTGTADDICNSYHNWNPIDPYVGVGDSTPLYGGDGITESLIGNYLDYAVGLATSPYVYRDTTTGVVTQTLGANNRSFLFVHPVDGAPGYWIVGDDAQTRSSATVNIIWHPYGTSVATTTANTEFAVLVATRTGVMNTYLNLFLSSAPASIAFSSSPFSASPDSFVGSYLNTTYSVDASSNARVLTVLYPSNPTHTKATFARIAPAGATGATITTGTVVDTVLISTPSVDVTQGGITYKGRIGFFRKLSGAVSQYFVRQGTKFDNGETTRTGFSSPVPVSVHMYGTSGSIVSTGTSITFYSPGITGVSFNGVTTSGTQGSNSFTANVPSGNVSVGLSGIFPSTPVVSVGGTVQFVTADTVTWSLASGSTGTISSTGLYTAPASFQAKNVIAGVPLIPNDHIYNVDITSLPVHSSSTARMANVGAGITVNFEVSFPLNVMTNATPTQSMKFQYTTSNDGRSFPIIADNTRGVETNLLPNDYFAQDRHQLGINTDSGIMTEIYNYYPVGTNTVNPCPTCNAQSGVQYGPMSYQLPNSDGSTDAAGLYIEPLAIRYDELKSGHIDHALRFTLSNGYNYSGFLWPGTNFAANCSNNATCFPYGSRLRLKASFSEAGFSPAALAVVRALKKYGMFMADGGINFHIQTMTSVLSDTSTYNALMVEIPASALDSGDFEQVDESSLMVSTATGRVAVPNTYNVVPSNYAVVIASKTSDHTTTQIWVAIQPVTVGTYNTPFPANSAGMAVMAGTPQFQIPTIVRGSAVTTATCSMSPSIGTLTSGCLYTAPASGILISSITTITMTATADSTATINFPLTIFPSDGIRINVGGKSAFTSSPSIPYVGQDYGPDVSGKYWASDPTGMIPPWYSQNDMGFPQASWGTPVSDVGLWYTERHATSDGAWSAMVPNGNYTLTMKFGRDSAPTNMVESIDSQGTVIISSTAFPSFIGSAAYTPVSTSTVVTVTNNQFYFAIRYPVASGSTFDQIDAWSLTYLSAIPSATPSSGITGNASLKGGVLIR